MAVGGVAWGVKGDELRVYTTDGKHYILVIEESESKRQITLLEEATASIHREVYDTSPMEVDGASGKDDTGAMNGESAAGVTSKQLRFYGVATSANGLFDAFVYTLSSTSDMEYKTDKFDVSYVSIRSAVSQHNEDVEDNLIEKLHVLLGRSDLRTYLLVIEHAQLMIYSANWLKCSAGAVVRWSVTYVLWDSIRYCEGEVAHWGEVEISFFHRFLSTLRDFYLAKEQESKTPDQSTSTRFSKQLYENCAMNSLRLMNFLCMHLKYAMAPALRVQMDTLASGNTKLLLQHYIDIALRSVEAYLTKSPGPLSGMF
ncbi:hypothetical protein HK104_009188 [Borealophlyctis nickersoniae]|nr:hypothetical protein HK104_009188 [Borealophlyctis nickersoniae]